jgi:hypothetical protein
MTRGIARVIYMKKPLHRIKIPYLIDCVTIYLFVKGKYILCQELERKSIKLFERAHDNKLIIMAWKAAEQSAS